MLKNRSIPFGYCMINGKYELNAVEAEAVRKIFEEYINGKSLKAIAAEMKIPYNVGKTTWNLNMVCRILENRKFIGENCFPRIVSNEVFEQANLIKAERSKPHKSAIQDELQSDSVSRIYPTEYEPTDEIQNINDEITRLLDSGNTNKSEIEKRIAELAELKYSAIKEVIM